MSVVLWVWLACATGAIALGTVRLWRRLSPRMFLRLAVPPVALAATLACAIAPLERRSWMADLTEDRRNSLSSLSKKVIDQADQDVRISAFFVPNRPGWERPTTLIKGYERLSSRVKVRFVDPNKRPGLARQYGVQFFGQVVAEGRGRREIANFADEIDVTGAVLRLTRQGDPHLCFVTGHGERRIGEGAELDEMQRGLSRSHMRTRTISLAATVNRLTGATRPSCSGPRFLCSRQNGSAGKPSSTRMGRRWCCRRRVALR